MPDGKTVLAFSIVTTLSLLYYYTYIQPAEDEYKTERGFAILEQQWSQFETKKYKYTVTQRNRLRRIKNYCDKKKKPRSTKKLSSYARNSPNFHTRGTAKGSYFVTKKKEAIFCAVPKVASTNWKRMFIVMEGAKNLGQLTKKSKVHLQPGLLSINSFSSTDRKSMLTKYYKFLFVRNPFERIVSAYRNKLADNNTFFEKTYGPRILRFSRENLSQKEYDEGKGTTFEEFAQWVAEKHPIDPHWVPVHQLCKPCTVPYTFVGKMETLYRDSEEILDHLGTKAKFPITWSDGYKISSKTLMIDYFSKMSKDSIDKLYKYYREDFEAFGYEIPLGINYTKSS